jgi:hypothetical protein
LAPNKTKSEKNMKKESPKWVWVWAVRALAALGLTALVLFGSKGSWLGPGHSAALICTTNPVVTTNADSGTGSLRDAIANACAGSTITFANTVVSPITLTSGELAIDANLTIQGPGADVLTISGGNSSRVFNVGSVNDANVTISGLTIANGKVTDTLGQGGGGILSNLITSNLVISNCTISGNTDSVSSTRYPLGGGICNNNTGTVTITNSTISGNTVSASTADGNAQGGGICNNNNGTVTITNSTISGNTAGGSGFSSGGGILNYGTVTIINSTVSGNEAENGGGIYNDGPVSHIANSTISGNTATYGGGVYNINTVTQITNNTISGNTATTGGGIYNGGTAETVISNIIAANTASGSGPDFSNADSVTSESYNLIGVSDGNSFVNGVNNDQVGSNAAPLNPMLGPLQNNGGPTFTKALMGGSPAINAGANPLALAFDQRGPDYPRVALGQADIGAYEYGDFCPTIDATVSGSAVICPGASTNVTVTVSGGTPPYTVTLNNNGGTMTGSSPLSFMVQPSAATIYSVASGIDSDECPVTGVGTATIAIDTATTATVTGGGTVCPGGSAMVTVSLSGGTAPYTVTLNNSGGTKTGSSPLTFMVSPSVSTTYSVSSVMDSIGCSASSIGSATIAVDTPTTATVSGGGTVCPGGLSSVTVTLSGGTAPYAVTLSNTGITKIGSSPLTFIVQPSSTTTYSVSSATDSIGCSATSGGSATVTVLSPPAVTLNPVSKVITGGSVTFTAAASGNPTPTVQWQVSTNGGASFTNIPGATSTTYTFTPTPSQSGDQFRAVFTNHCSTATTTAATLTIFDQCLKDNSNGNLLQFNSVTGQYVFTVCSTGFTLSGTGTVGLASGIRTLTVSTASLKLSAAVNTGSRTGTATIYVEAAPGVWQTYRINDTNPSATCSCAT